MNENDGGGVCCSLSLLLFFPLFPLPHRVEPHIGSVGLLDICNDCSSPLQQIRFFSIEISQTSAKFRSIRIEQTLFYRMICISSIVRHRNMKKFRQRDDEQDQI